MNSSGETSRSSTMQATLEQLTVIAIFANLQSIELARLQPCTQMRHYQQGETVMGEGEILPAKLYALAEGVLQIAKTATTGKETILRTLSAGEFFAAPALLGNGIAPATATAKSDCWVLTVERSALLEAIQHHPDIALQMMQVLNYQRGKLTILDEEALEAVASGLEVRHTPRESIVVPYPTPTLPL